MKKVEHQKTKKHYKNDETSEPQSTNPSDPDSRFDGTTQGMKTYRAATPGEKKGKLCEVVKSVVREALDKLEEEDPCWKGYKMLGMKEKNGRKVPNCVKEDAKGYKSPSGGLTPKGRKAYHHKTGGTLLPPAKDPKNHRHISFCARMGGMKEKLTSDKTANDSESRINKSLRNWNCE